MILFLLLFLSGCGFIVVPLAVAGAGVVGYKMSSRNGPKGYIEDVKVKMMLRKKFKQAGLPNIALLVFDRKVMFCGNVSNVQIYKRVVLGVESVEQVIDKTQIAPVLHSNFAADALIKTQLKSSLLLNMHVQSRNIRIKVLDRVIYVLGVVLSEDERVRILSNLMQVRNVRRVEQHLEVRKSE